MAIDGKGRALPQGLAFQDRSNRSEFADPFKFNAIRDSIGDTSQDS